MFNRLGRWIRKFASLNAVGAASDRQAGFASFFILMGYLFFILITIYDSLYLPFSQTPEDVAHVIVDLTGILIWTGLHFMARKGFTRFANLGMLATWLAMVTFLLTTTNPDQFLILFFLPTACAGFMTPAVTSMIIGGLSIIDYTILFALTRHSTPYNSPFVFSILVTSLACWAVSERIDLIVAELQKSNQKYSELLEHIPNFIYIISGDTPGKVIYASPIITPLLGYTPEEWISNPDLWKERLHPEDRKRVLEEWADARDKNRMFQAEYRLLSRDGRMVWVMDQAIAIHPPSEPVRIQGIMLDITSRKRYEAVQSVIYKISQAAISARNLDALFKEIHQNLATLMHAENFFIALFDPSTQTLQFPYFVDQFDSPPLPRPLGHGLTEYVLRTGQPLFVNPTGFADMVVAGEADSIGAPSLDWLGVPLKMMDRTIGVMAVQSYTEGIRYNQEDLEILTFVSSQAAMAIERKQSDEALRYSEQLYHTTIDSLSELIHVIDRNGMLLMQNQSFRNRNQRLGLPVEITGKTLPEAFPFQDTEILHTYEAVFETGDPFSFVDEHTINGESFIYDTDIVPIIENGRAERAITVLRDITDEKIAEKKLKDALQEKEVLLREIHHRVKNNLQVIHSLLSLQADYIDDPHALVIFQETQARLRSMAFIHEELYQSADLARIDYSEYIQKLTSNLFQAFSINPNVQLELQLSNIYLGVEIAIPCGLIINELVTNALKYAFPNDRPGMITVCLENDPTGSQPNSYILVVEDNGIGIPVSYDFTNTQTLGLQLVNILVRQIKGQITLDRTCGSRFVITFFEEATY